MPDSVPVEPNVTPEPPEKPSDWKIGELYQKALPIVKTNKVLWIFGLALAATESSVNSRGNGGNNSFESIQKLFQNNQNSHNDLSMVLGAATSSFQDTLAAIFSAIPFYFYVAVGLEILFLIIVSIAISIIYQSWAEAGLLQGIQTATANGNVTIHDTSEKAFRSIKKVAFVRIVPMLLLALAVLIFFVLMAIPLLGPLSGLLIFCGVLFFLFALVMIMFSQTWAVRKVVLEDLQAKQALREGYRITLKKFWPMLGLSILNVLLKIGIGLAIVLVLLGPAIGIILSIYGLFPKNIQLGIPLIVLASVFIVAFFVASEAAGGILTSFVNTVWSLAYQNIKGKYDK